VFDPEPARAFAERLSTEIGVRPAGSDADLTSRDLIADEFRAVGWDVELQEFDLPQGGTSWNVVASLGPPPVGPHAVIGAHRDTVDDSPGANDNGTGVGVVLSLAAELADEGPRPLVLIAFGAEEYQPSDPREHHIGSAAYAEAHPAVTAALSVDMVGNGAVTCICWYDAGPRTLADELASLAEHIDPDGFEVRLERDVSDHGPFARRGIPAAFLWTGDDGRYDSPADTPEHLVRGDIRRAGDLSLAWARTLT